MKNKTAFISCEYTGDDTPLKGYKGFLVIHGNGREVFDTQSPPEDFKNAQKYALETRKARNIYYTSSVYDFVAECDKVFKWYTDEYESQFFDYADKIESIKNEIEEKFTENKKAIIYYIEHSLGIDNELATQAAYNLYYRFGEQIMPKVREYYFLNQPISQNND